MAAFPASCVSSETPPLNGTLGACTFGASIRPNGSQMSSHGVNRESWVSQRSRRPGALASAATVKNAKRQ